MARLLVLLASALVAAGCAGGEADAPAPPADTDFETAPAVIEKAGGETVELTVELARTPDERARGLMGRESLPDDHGMLFVFGEPVRADFWMKDTLIPLSIAFIGDTGRIREIVDMEPCRADPCPVYSATVTYRRALEVNRGAFRRWGVEVGDRFRLLQPGP